jgi:hypothetical protein
MEGTAGDQKDSNNYKTAGRIRRPPAYNEESMEKSAGLRNGAGKRFSMGIQVRRWRFAAQSMP